MRYNKPRRNRFRSNDKGFRRNGSTDMRTGSIDPASNNFQRRFFNRNGLKAEKLLEKYNNLAKEALSNGDEILSENYYQFADHFLRVIENRHTIQNNPKSHLDGTTIQENSDDKIILEDKKNSSSKQPQNSEEQPQNSEEQPQNSEEI